MDNPFNLSIAIPTYNRSEQLIETLESILNQLPQINENIEIVISDNCSTDDTEICVKQYMEKHSFIKYHKNDVNQGIDFNIYKCTNLASGKYVHLLSDDDILMEGSISYILNLINKHNDISFFYLNGRGFDLDKDKNRIFDSNPVINKKDNEIFNNKNEFVTLLKTQITFISAFLLHRESWNMNMDKDRFIGTDIYLSYDLIHLLANSNKYMYISKDLVGVHKDYTAGNYRIFHAFAYQWRKLLLEEAVSIGFDKKIMRQLFSNSIDGLEGRIKAIKRGGINANINLTALNNIVSSTYDTKVFWFKLLPALLKPAFIYRLEVKFKKYRKGLKKVN